jgi:hypothetical protein
VDYKRLKKGVKHLGPDEGDLDQPPTPTHSTACDSEAGGNEVAVVTTQSQQQQQRTAAVAAAASSLSAGAAAAAQRRAASDAGAGGAAAAGGGTAGDASRYIYSRIQINLWCTRNETVCSTAAAEHCAHKRLRTTATLWCTS